MLPNSTNTSIRVGELDYFELHEADVVDVSLQGIIHPFCSQFAR